MKVTQQEIELALRRLTETPGRLAATTEALNDEQLHQRPDEENWSANEILAHLRACADVWGETIAAMLQDNEPALKHLHPRTWQKETNYLEIPFRESFRDFVDQRRALLETLSDLSLADWSRGAIIKERRHTIFSQARRMALHEATHCEQIEALSVNLST
jgi:uncharacterized damage-inducible protein DinB